MAIPVDKAPQPYRPPAPSAVPTDLPQTGTLDDLRRIEPSDPRVRQVQVRLGRGCALAGLLGMSTLCVLSGVLLWLLIGFTTHELNTQARGITEVLRETARAEGRESTVDADLVQFDALLREDRVSLAASLVLVERNRAAKLNGAIEPEELDRMMEVIHDAVLHDGEIDPARYPDVGNAGF